MNLAVPPQTIAQIRMKGIDFDQFQKLRKIWKVQLIRINHKQNLQKWKRLRKKKQQQNYHT